MPDPFAPLIDIARRGLPFTASDGQAFVRLHALSPGAFYILPVRSRAYREWFFHEFFAQFETLPPSRAFHSLLNHLEAEANHNLQNQPSRPAPKRACSLFSNRLGPISSPPCALPSPPPSTP